VVAVIQGKLATAPGFFVETALASLFVFVLWRVLVSDLADEVLDCGDHLVVRRGKLTDRIDLSNVLKIDSSWNTSPSRITLHLIHPGKFGKLVTFAPAAGVSGRFFSNSAVAKELLARAQDGRVGNAG